MSKKTGNERIKLALRDVRPDDLTVEARRDSRFELRLTRADHESIRETAQGLGMSAAEYLLSLHKYAVGKLRDK